jgi:hypothetical protein
VEPINRGEKSCVARLTKSTTRYNISICETLIKQVSIRIFFPQSCENRVKILALKANLVFAKMLKRDFMSTLAEMQDFTRKSGLQAW